jgi:pyruvate formate lyase activating enzyme
MKITQIVQDSLIDFPGKTSLVVFTAGCNFHCPACYAKQVTNGEKSYDAFRYIGSLTTGVTVCGGEPTIHSDLPEFLGRIKERGLAVKLDTNGSRPEVIRDILEKKLVNYIAMDVKSCPKWYVKVVGDDNSYVDYSINKIEESMKAISDSGINYEFRTTLAPMITNQGIRYPTGEEFREMGNWIARVTGKNDHKLYLQEFRAMGENEMIDSRFVEDKLAKEMRKTPSGVFQLALENLKPILLNTEVR